MLRKNDGKILIVEIKSILEKDDIINGKDGVKAKKLYEIDALNKEKIKYCIFFVTSSSTSPESITQTKKWLYE